MRLIDAEALIKSFYKKFDKEELQYTQPFIHASLTLLEKFIDNAPTIEAKPIIHAHWNYDGEDDWTGLCSWFCSNCSSFIETEEDTLSCGYNFCPNCGAQMDEVVK